MTQTEYVGRESIANLGEAIKTYNPTRILLVTGDTSYEKSGARDLLAPILSPYTVVHSIIRSDKPELTVVTEEITRFREISPDAVIAVGGGTVIDTAKLINILSHQDDNPRLYCTGERSIEKKGCPLIAIPTTSGSGSEATRFAVVYIDGMKHSITHMHLLPDVAIVDPQFTYSLAAHITASSGMDALSQAVESYWSISSTDESKRYAQEAIELALEHLPAAVNGNDTKARDGMSIAAHTAGKAINIAKTTATHALSYVLTSQFHVSHGEAVGIFLPAFIEFNDGVTSEDVRDDRGVDYVQTTLKKLYAIAGVDDARHFREKIVALKKDIGLASTLSEVGVNSADLVRIAGSVNMERLANNPRAVTPEQIRDLLHTIL